MPNHSLEQLKPLTGNCGDCSASTQPHSKRDKPLTLQVSPHSIDPVPFDPSASEPSFHGESAVDSVTPTHKTIAGFLPENVFKSAIKTDLPRLRERIEKTEQLVYCNTLLLMSQSSSSAIATTKEKDEGFLEGSDGNGQQGPYDERIISSNLDESERAWMQALQQKPVEQHYLRWLVTKVVEEFVKDDIKSPAAIAEAVILGPVLNRDSFRSLLSCFIQKLERSTLPDISLLEGLVQLVESASSGHLEYNDLVKTLAVLQHRLKGTHKRPFEHLSRTILAVCRVLDVIVNGTFKHLNRTEDHHPLAVILDELKDSKEPMLQFQVNYALQALQYVPDDKSSYEATKSILSGMEASQRSRLVDMENFLKGICTGTKHEWYLTLLAARMFVRDGRLADFNRTVCEAHCRNERAFQLGVCQILGEIAVDPLWNPVTRQRVVDLMGAIYNGNTDWQQHRDVKQWIFSIITQLSGLPDAIIKDQVDSILQVLNQDGITADLKFFPLKTRTPRPETSPLLERAHKILYIEHDLHRMVERRLDEVERRLDEVQQPQIYIPPMAKANLQARDEDIFPLMSKVEEFLASDHQVMLILGASGAGKSTFNKHLESQLLRYYKCGDSIPLFINLSALENPARDLMMEQLKEKDFSEMQIQELKLNRQFVVICDGYDESQLTANLHATNKFNRPGQWNVKLLISCRTDYLGPDSNYHDRFAPHGIDHYHGLALDLFQEAAIAPFSMDQIHDYVEMYVSSEPQTWSTQDYMDKLSTIPKLMELVENPLLLSLALKALPRVTKDKQDLSTIRITPVRLYDTFVTDWLDINEIRLQRKTLSEEDRDALFQLVEAGFETEGIEYSTNLASAMFEKQDGKVTVQYTHHKDKTTWKAKFFSSDPAVRLLRESSFLTRSGRYYQFLHRSMLEYFFSRTIVGPRNIEHVGEFPPQPASDTSHVQLLKSKCPLFTRNLVAESSVVQFLCERVQENANFKKELLEVIEISKSDASKATAAANAITILVKAGVTFHRYDFGGIRIPGADLSGGQFDSSNFHGADLKGVNLGMSWLRNANFRYALMKEVKFGELSYLEGLGKAWACCHSPNGKILAVVAENGDVILYDTSTWERIRSLPGYSNNTECLAFSPDSQWLVYGTDYGPIRVWDCSNGDLLWTMEGHMHNVRSVAFSPCGRKVASAGADKTVRLWDLVTGEALFVLEGHTDIVKGIRFTSDGQRVVSGSCDETIRFWDAKTGGPEDVWEPGQGAVTCLAISPDGDQLVSGHLNGMLMLWGAATGSVGLALPGHIDAVMSVLFSANGKRIASASLDSTVRLLDSAKGTIISVFRNSCPVFDVSMSLNGLHLASVDCSDRVRLWDIRSTGFSIKQHGHSNTVTTVAYTPNGQSIMSSGQDRTVLQWDALTGDTGSTHPFSKNGITVVVISPDLKQTAAAHGDGTIHLRDSQTGELRYILGGHTHYVTALVYSKCSHWIASVGWDMTVRLWDMRNSGQGQDIYVLRDATDVELDANSIWCAVAFSPNGTHVAVGDVNGLVNVYDTQTRTLYMTTRLEGEYVSALAFSLNGQELTIGVCRGLLFFWDLQSNEKLGYSQEIGYSGFVRIVYSPCERWIACGDYRNNVRLCRRQLSGMEVHWCVLVIEGFLDLITDIAWNPVDPLEFVTGSRDSSVRVWRILEDNGNGVVSVELVWGSGIGMLAAFGMRLDGVTGLDAYSRKLLTQRGAVNDSFDSQDEWNMAPVMT